MPDAGFPGMVFNRGVKNGRRLLASLLSLLCAATPSFAAVVSVPHAVPRVNSPAVLPQVRLSAPLGGVNAPLTASLTGSLAQALPVLPAFTAPQLAPSPAVSALRAAPAASASPAAPAAVAADAAKPVFAALSAAQDAPQARAEQPSAETQAASGRARFDLAAARPASEDAVAGTLSAPADAPRLDAPTPNPQKPKKSLADRVQVFKDVERNRAFWRYFTGEQIYMLGIQMYVVALPFLMKAFTRNTLAESGRLATMTPDAVNALVRENRSNSRIAHWVAQAVSYAAIPLFTNNGERAPKHWLVRSSFIRAAVLGGIPALFFATGLMSGPVAMWTLFGLIAVQSFFQGLHATSSSGSIARILGDKSVTAEERVKANSIRTFAGAVVALLAPAIAGRIAGMPDWLGKAGTGSAVIYGVYALLVGLSGLVFAGVKLIGDERKSAAPGAAPAGPRGVGGAIKSVWTSLKEGLAAIWQNRFLRTMLIMDLIGSLFSDPLTFNVLPEFVEGVFRAGGGSLAGLSGIPVVGWFVTGLMSTPMGFFGLMVAASSLGSIVVSLLASPLRRLFERLGFKTEERLTIPFYILSFLEVPAFWWMIHTPSFMTVLVLFGLQTVASGFASLMVQGIYQRKLGEQGQKKATQVLAAASFVSILAAIVSTILYGYVLNGIPVATSLLIAGGAVTTLGLIRLAAPWLFFSKAERKGEPPQPPAGFLPPDDEPGHHAGPDLRGPNGPLSLGQ